MFGTMVNAFPAAADAEAAAAPSRAVSRLVASGVVAVSVMCAAVPAAAGPWSRLPDAIDRIIDGAGDENAEQVLVDAEMSILREATAGRLVAARALYDTYASLVSSLPAGSFRLRTVERRLAARLVEVGDRFRQTEILRAAEAWVFAAELDETGPAVDRLRTVLLPPVEAEAGDVWRSPLDGAALVFHPPATIRLGCTQNDNACLDNEIIFRWIKVPARWVESREVSNRRYRRCVEAGACTPPEDATAYDDPTRVDHPVVGVTWRQARSYARWAGRRLPSEAEWERAARGEIITIRFPWGNDRRRELANVWTEPPPERPGTRPVGSYPALGYGVRDMPGNVWEWCEDRYQKRFSEASDDGGAARKGWGRVVRGGSWRRTIDMARVSTRSWYEAGYSADDLGFRCVMDHDPEIDVGWLIRVARRAFPTRSEPGLELRGAEIEAEDRRYLERRSLTLFVVEGRAEEALIPAARRQAIDPKDPVAREVFARFETEMLADASGDDLAGVRRGVAAYEGAVEVVPRLTGRFAGFLRQLVLVLRRTVADLEQRGDRRGAMAAARLGVELAPDDGVFAAAVARLEPATGTARVWPADGKGMVWIAPQQYKMGAVAGDNAAGDNERPAHLVTVDGFWIDRTEVTNDEYRECVRAGACSPPERPEHFEDPRMGAHPVMWVTWFQAREYAAWAGKRLPSEAEWELAARAGSTEAFPWGSSWVPGSANAIGSYRQDRWSGTAPVASFEPNPWGLYDLVGNASEWVEDVFNGSYFGAPRDGRPWYQETGAEGERRRVVRGGAWDDPPQRQRLSRRVGRQPDNISRSVGFRCVADEEPQ